MILGFGIVETDIAKRILKECYEAIKKDKDAPAKATIETIRSVYNKQYDEYGQKDASEVPERYCCFWAYKSEKYFRFDFHHINRRHPMSNDGWAMMKSTWILDMTTGRIFEER